MNHARRSHPTSTFKPRRDVVIVGKDSDRIGRLRDVADSLGLRFSETDSANLWASPYWLFGHGPGLLGPRKPSPIVRYVLSGLQDMSLALTFFDLHIFYGSDYFWSRSAAIVDVVVDVPHLMARPKGAVSQSPWNGLYRRRAERLGLACAVEGLSPDYVVYAEDHDYARQFFSGEVVHRVRSAHLPLAVELNPRLLFTTEFLVPEVIPSFLAEVTSIGEELRRAIQTL